MATERYGTQRQPVVPPHVSIRSLRKSRGLHLQEVCAQVDLHLAGPKPFTKGALSAIERGHRGASAQVINALERVYGLERGDITTTYQPRQRDAA